MPPVPALAAGSPAAGFLAGGPGTVAVSALALALVYGLGGRFALTGALDAGSVVTLALLLARLYAPLTSLAGARVDIMSALVSFERVFEVLDLKPDPFT